MGNLKLGQNVANTTERKQTAAHIVAKSHPLCKLQECVVTVLFLTSTPLAATS